MGGLSTITAPRLGAIAIKGALDKINLDPNLVDEVLWVRCQAGTGQAPARQAAIYAGLPNTVACTTINKVCASGMKADMARKPFKLVMLKLLRNGKHEFDSALHAHEKRNQIWSSTMVMDCKRWSCRCIRQQCNGSLC
jgi:hypothetical protein